MQANFSIRLRRTLTIMKNKWLDKPKEKKARPNSAQNITSSGKFNSAHETPNGANDDLETPVKPIDELPEIPATSRISEVSNLIEEPKNIEKFIIRSSDKDSLNKPQLFSNDEYSVNSKQLESIYRPNGKPSLINFYLEHDHEAISEYKVKMKSTSQLKKKRTSKSKDQRDKNEQDEVHLGFRKYSNRPFSGDTISKNLQKVNSKSKNLKIRPKTAKKLEKTLEKDLKSPTSDKLMSPKTVKKRSKRAKTKHRLDKTAKKNNSNKFNRNTSLSPKNDNKKKLLTNINKTNKNTKKQAFSNNRYSMNDIRRMFIFINFEFLIETKNKQIKINLVTHPSIKHDINRHLIIIQKFMRGYFIRK